MIGVPGVIRVVLRLRGIDRHAADGILDERFRLRSGRMVVPAAVARARAMDMRVRVVMTIGHGMLL